MSTPSLVTTNILTSLPKPTGASQTCGRNSRPAPQATGQAPTRPADNLGQISSLIRLPGGLSGRSVATHLASSLQTVNVDSGRGHMLQPGLTRQLLTVKLAGEAGPIALTGIAVS